ncbi:MAG: PD-(D/E)XK nuclease family protein [Planctomycetes bacterium]|nr:PD-(D/E)XK nuclease family protein [Planctomycetota bacterium]
MGIELLRVPLEADVSGFVAALLRDAARASAPFAPAPVIYMGANERRARAISRAAGEQYPEGTPDRVARELLRLTAPTLVLRGEVERDFDFFGALAATLDELGEKRRPGRALVDELLIAWKRLAQAVPPNQRGDLGWLSQLGRRGELLGGVVRRYLERLKQTGQYDPEDAPWLAATHCDARPKLVVADDLDRITPAREAFLRALADRAERTLIILRGNREALPFLADAHEVSQQLMFATEGSVVSEREWPVRPLGHACRVWLGDEPLTAPIALLRPPTRGAEVREAARLIKRAYAEGIAPGDICVAMPSPGAYRELIEETFTASGIPYDAPFELPLDETAPVAALLDLLRTARNGLERNELLDALASPFLPFEASDEDARLRIHGSLDAVTRDVYVVGGRDVRRDWLDKLEAAAHPERDVILEPARHILQLLAPFTKRQARAVSFFEALETLLGACGAPRVAKADSRAGAANASLHAGALHAFTGLLHEMREEFRRIGNPDMPVGELSRALLEQARARSVRPPEGDAPRVRVLGLRELRGMSIRHLVVLGLTDRDLPLAAQETLFLPAAHEEALAGVLGARVARELCAPIDVAAQGDYLFAHMLLCAGDALTLMLPAAESDTPFVPATPFARLLRCMAQNKLEGIPASAHGELPTSPGDLAARAGALLTKAERDGSKREQALALSPALRVGLHGRCMELARTDMASPPHQYEGIVGRHAELAAKFASDAAEPYLFSPSQIDSYAECPMRFWGRYILGVKAPEDPTLDTKPSAVGTLLHEVFERWVLLLRQEAGQPDVLADATARGALKLSDAGGRDVGLRLIAQAFEYACQKNPSEGPFWEGVKQLVAAGLPGRPDDGLGEGLLVRFVDHELARNAEGWGIRFVEFDFGKGNEPRPDRPDTVAAAIDLETPEGRLRLMGSVDRVDEGPDGLEIIDYKTGRAKTTGDVRDGKAFQLPTYLAAISQLAGTPPRGMKYFRVPPEGAIEVVDVTVANRKPAYDVDELVSTRLPERLQRIVNALRHGVFLHTPFARLTDACKYCDYAAACARREDVISERQTRMAEAETPEVPHVYLPEAK